MYETAETDQQRENAVVHLQQLDALDEIDALHEVIATYRERAGSAPGSWQELIQAGFLTGIPRDPTGSPYVYDATTQEVGLSQDSELGILPTQ